MLPFYINITLTFSSILLLIAILCIIYKIIFKSHILTKLVALEMLANSLVAVIALWAFYTKQLLFLDISIAIVLIMFLGTVANVQFILSRRKK